MSVWKIVDGEEHIKFVPGTIVKISNLSKPSYYLYKKFTKQSPLLVCPCHLKRDIPLVVEDIFEKGIVLLKGKRGSFLTMTYASDLEAIYER